MKESMQQTIYSYKLLYRFRWRGVGYLTQLLLIGFSLIGISLLLDTPVVHLIVNLAILPAIPVCHLLVFRLYAKLQLQKPHTTADMLVSPWWGTGYQLPVPISLYRATEGTVIVGSLLFAGAAYVWLPVEYGLVLLAGTFILALPRLLAWLASLRQPQSCRVKYEERGVAFLSTDG